MAELLVVDDNPSAAKLMSRLLTQAGHRIATCAWGVEALKSQGIQPNDESIEPPDFMILDIIMSQSDGFITKPFSSEDLVGSVQGYSTSARPRA